MSSRAPAGLWKMSSDTLSDEARTLQACCAPCIFYNSHQWQAQGGRPMQSATQTRIQWQAQGRRPTGDVQPNTHPRTHRQAQGGRPTRDMQPPTHPHTCRPHGPHLLHRSLLLHLLHLLHLLRVWVPSQGLRPLHGRPSALCTLSHARIKHGRAASTVHTVHDRCTQQDQTRGQHVRRSALRAPMSM